MSDLYPTNTVNVLSAPTIRASLVLKHGSAANWAAINPVLIKGEMGIEIDTGLLKVGDGVSSFADLPYINITEAGFNNKIEGVLSSYIQKPENFIKGNLPMFAEDGSLIDSGLTPGEYIGGAIATEDVPGGVISSEDDNSISVNGKGKMSLNRVSTSNLFVPDNEELIFFAGGADF